MKITNIWSGRLDFSGAVSCNICDVAHRPEWPGHIAGYSDSVKLYVEFTLQTQLGTCAFQTPTIITTICLFATMFTNCIKASGNAITSVCPSVCFHSIFTTDWLLTWNFCMWVGHDHSSQGIEGQGQANAVIQTQSGEVFSTWSEPTRMAELPCSGKYNNAFSCFDSQRRRPEGQRRLMIAWVKILPPTPHNIGHFGDVPCSQSLGYYWTNWTNTARVSRTQIYYNI